MTVLRALIVAGKDMVAVEGIMKVLWEREVMVVGEVPTEKFSPFLFRVRGRVEAISSALATAPTRGQVMIDKIGWLRMFERASAVKERESLGNG